MARRGIPISFRLLPDVKLALEKAASDDGPLGVVAAD
jgi:hypothetical protein